MEVRTLWIAVIRTREDPPFEGEVSPRVSYIGKDWLSLHWHSLINFSFVLPYGGKDASLHWQVCTHFTLLYPLLRVNSNKKVSYGGEPTCTWLSGFSINFSFVLSSIGKDASLHWQVCTIFTLLYPLLRVNENKWSPMEVSPGATDFAVFLDFFHSSFPMLERTLWIALLRTREDPPFEGELSTKGLLYRKGLVITSLTLLTTFYPSLPLFEGRSKQRVSYGGQPRSTSDLAVFLEFFHSSFPMEVRTCRFTDKLAPILPFFTPFWG